MLGKAGRRPESGIACRTSRSSWALCQISLCVIGSAQSPAKYSCSGSWQQIPWKINQTEYRNNRKNNVCLQICYVLVIFLTVSLFSPCVTKWLRWEKKKKNLYFQDWRFYLPNLRGRNFVPWQMMRWGWRLTTALTFFGFRQSFLFLGSVFFLAGSNDVSIPAVRFLKLGSLILIFLHRL